MKTIRKLFMSILCISFISLFFVSSVSADRTPIEFMMKRMNYLQGTWYGVKDPSKTVIFNGGLFNDKQIIGFENLVGEIGDFDCTMIVKEVNNQKKYLLKADGLAKTNPYHQYLCINGIVYSKSQEPLYRESVGGIYLGMPVTKLQAVYGDPDLIEQNRDLQIFAYTRLGMMLDIRNGIVQQIRIFKYGDRKLDSTLLDCNHSLDDFKEAYGLSRIHIRGANPIGKGEYLWFDDYSRSITLSLYSN